MNQIERRAPNSDLLKTFVIIAEAQNLTMAADRLGRTQSAISIQLKKLEDQLGVSLFDRHARGMTPSAEGRRFLPAARRALAEVQRAGNLFAAPITGRIAVGIPDDFENMILEAALAGFARRNPGVEIVAQSGCTAQYPDAIRKGDLDVAVCSGPGDLPGQPLSAEPVFWAAGLTRDIDPAKPLPLVFLDRPCWWRDIMTDALEAAGRDWTIAYRSSSFTSIGAAVRAGLGVGALPRSAMDAGMRALGAEDGLPPLPSAHRVIMQRADAPAELATAMAQAIRDAVLGQG